MANERMNCLKQVKIDKFLAGDGRDSERAEIETHLANCSNCRLDFTRVYSGYNEGFFPAPKELKQRAKRLPKQRIMGIRVLSFFWTRQAAFAMTSLAVVFSIVGVWFWNTGQTQLESGGDVFRQGKQNSDLPTLISPQNNVNLAGEEIEFIWNKLSAANSYDLIISDGKGDIVFEENTKKDRLSVATSEIKLIPKKYYFWYVRAKHIDGRIKETRPRKFSFGN